MTLIFIICILLFVLAYLFYAGLISRKYQIDDANPTPANRLKDNLDYLPTPPYILFGHHFSSIAGAGPVIGPIIAALHFGWLPALIWIVLGAIFIGAVHDFSSLVVSIRHNAKSIAEVTKIYISKSVYKAFLIYIWFTLVYVIAVFADLTSATFTMEGGVATSSIIYIFLAVIFGLFIYRLNLPLKILSVIFIPIVFLTIFLGQKIPLKIPPIFLDPHKTCAAGLLVYCFIASILPVWLLLQPRDYLSSFLLLFSVLVGCIGSIFLRKAVNYPAFIDFHSPEIGTLIPFLFVTVACGAVSGFHSLVASGTTSKQLLKETHAKPIGYGAMLVEGIIAVISVLIIMALQKTEGLLRTPPMVIYGNGVAEFFNVLGMPKDMGYRFGILALSAFTLTTLDTATRISRYIFQEFFNLSYSKTRFQATFISLILPAILIFFPIKIGEKIIPAWRAIWPIFGTVNQLLAALTLLVVYIWLRNMKKPAVFVLIPLIFMFLVTTIALIMHIVKYGLSILGVTSTILLAVLIYVSARAIKLK